MLAKLDRKDRLRLMRFACSFAWADLEIRPKERAFVEGLQKQLELSAEEAASVKKWLEVPPRPEEVDPAAIPAAHREIFLKAAWDMIASDGEIDPAERETYELFEQLLK